MDIKPTKDSLEKDMLSFAEGSKWKSIPKLSPHVPFGYVDAGRGDGVLDPVPYELETLAQAKIHLRRFSSRNVAAWVTEVTGRKISHTGLIKRLKNERSRQRKIETAKSWARRYAECIAQAEEFEESLKGRQTYYLDEDGQYTFDFAFYPADGR